MIIDLHFIEEAAALEGKDTKNGPGGMSEEVVMIYMKLDGPDPAGVKISKRNICQIELVPET